MNKFKIGVEYDFIEKKFYTEYFGYQDIVSSIGGTIGFILPALSITLVPLTSLMFVVLFAKYYLVNYED